MRRVQSCMPRQVIKQTKSKLQMCHASTSSDDCVKVDTTKSSPPQYEAFNQYHQASFASCTVRILCRTQPRCVTKAQKTCSAACAYQCQNCAGTASRKVQANRYMRQTLPRHSSTYERSADCTTKRLAAMYTQGPGRHVSHCLSKNLCRTRPAAGQHRPGAVLSQSSCSNLHAAAGAVQIASSLGLQLV